MLDVQNEPIRDQPRVLVAPLLEPPTARPAVITLKTMIGSKTVVGIVSDAVYRSIRDPVQPTIYMPLAQWGGNALLYTNFFIAAQSSTPFPARLARSVAAALIAVNPDVSPTFRSLADQVNDSLVQDRVVAVLSGFFGGLALLLAGLGLYGVTAYAVARRCTEIAIRMALGAAPVGVVRLVLSRVSKLIGVGIVAGAGRECLGIDDRQVITLRSRTARSGDPDRCDRHTDDCRRLRGMAAGVARVTN